MSDPAPTFFQQTWVKVAVAAVLIGGGTSIYKALHPAPKITMENIVALNVSLSTGETASTISDAPACGADGPACMTLLAAYMGSRTGFRADKPDQASCAAVALTLTRDHRGDFAPDSNAWMNMLRVGQGPGVDALRMAVARQMAEAAPNVGVHADDEAAATKLMGEIAKAVPGACNTYAMIARGDALSSFAPEDHPDHSACVQRDLSRRDGPGGRYGNGVFRAAEGAAALWREEERALRMGAGAASPAAKKLIGEKLAIIEPATLKIAIKQVESTEDQMLTALLGDVHADAGIVLWKGDAGAGDAGAGDAGQTQSPGAHPRNPGPKLLP